MTNSMQSIGAILIDSGRLQPQDAEKVIQLQHARPELKFGDAAIELGLVTSSDIQDALSDQFVYPYLGAEDQHVSREVIAAFEPFSDFVEQLRVLRSQLLIRWFDGETPRRAISIVGEEHGAGRSFIAANLAVVFSQLGQKTLLVDGDMRKPRQHELFSLESRIGFSSVLAGRSTWRDAIEEIGGFQDLSVLGAGPLPPNPQELLCRPWFGQLVRELENQFDVIIFDSPAASDFSDAQTISAKIGAALVVASRHQSTSDKLVSMVDGLRQCGAQIVGSVLNRD